ncbi:MAG: histidine kinase [Planctomycetia bacterium]|nr:histidine kinase [Planctomycetia bacterium]
MPSPAADVIVVSGSRPARAKPAQGAGLPAAVRLSPAIAEAVFWLAHVAFWAFAFVASLVVVEVFQPAIIEPVSFVATRIACCFIATAVMRELSQREWLLLRLGMSKIGLVAGGAIFSAVVITLLLFWVDRAWGGAAPAQPRLALLALFVINLTLLANWCALYFGQHLVRERNSTEFRALEAESLALKNELQHLQGQISPHFLFNALNTVVASRDDPEAIDTVTQALANYLRFLLQPAAPLEPLSRELDALEQYLTVQAMRFGDGLVTRIDCDLDVSVEVKARREENWLVIEVANTGRWVAAGGQQSTGTGLHSLERRLRLLLGPSATVNHREDNGWVRVRLRLPIRTAVPRPATVVAGGKH